MKNNRLGILLKCTVKSYFTEKISRLAAALAFYTTFAIAPLLVIAIALAGIVFEEDTARQRVIGQIEQLAGSEAGRALRSVEHPATEKKNTAMTLLGVISLLGGGLGVFLHLQDALNTIWHVRKNRQEHWFAILKRRLFSFATVLVTGFILLVSLIVSAVLNWLGQHAAYRMNWPPAFMEVLNALFSFGIITFFFAMIFKLLPDTDVRWQNVGLGAVVTSLLFIIGKTILGLYLARSHVTSSYGAAGSLIVLLLWSYYSAQIVFIGAQFTRMHALTQGGRTPDALKTQMNVEHSIA